MRLEHGLRSSAIARQYPVGEALMGGDEFPAAVEAAHHHPAVAVGLVIQIRMRGQKPLRSARRQECGVERLVKPVEIRRALAKIVAGSLDVPAHLVQRRNASISTTVRIRVISARSSRLTSATLKPRWPMPTINPRDTSRDRPSRSGVAPIS
jgi:hypothetical protein